jgi:hypothetical protein
MLRGEALCQGGWEMHRENGNDTRLTMPPGRAKAEARAGETLQRTFKHWRVN